MSQTIDKKKVLALSSGGGHWIELLRVRPAFAGCAVSYATTSADLERDIADEAQVTGCSAPRFFVFRDANRWQKRALFIQLLQIIRIVLTVRPHVIVSTGASAGYFAIRMGKLMGARTLWLDSIANAEELSLSGEKAGAHVDLWLTQWPHLEQKEGPFYKGSVL